MKIKITLDPKQAQAGVVLCPRKHYSTEEALDKAIAKYPSLQNWRYLALQVDGRWTACFLYNPNEPILAPVQAGFAVIM